MPVTVVIQSVENLLINIQTSWPLAKFTDYDYGQPDD